MGAGSVSLLEGVPPGCLLGFETSGPQCSVALTDGGGRWAARVATGVNDHAQVLTPLVQECMQELGVEYAQLEGVAVSNGPGSYTGLRIGLSTAKGLCYALGIRLIPVGTLQAMAYAMRHALGESIPGDALLLPMLDARRSEVYVQPFNALGEPEAEPCAVVVPEGLPPSGERPVYYAGSGAGKVAALGISARWSRMPELAFTAESVLALALRGGGVVNPSADIAYVEPYYLKDFQATTPRRSAAGLPGVPGAT